MNIVIINHYAGSPEYGMEYRHFYLAREWVQLGHNVSIIAASYSHLRSQQPHINGITMNEDIKGIHYCWLKTCRYRGNGIGRVLNMLIFSFMLILLKPEIVNRRKPDLVIASSPHPFVIAGAHLIARASGAKLMFEVRDLWPLTLTELGGTSPRHPFIIMMQKAEDFAYRVSHGVISLLPKAYDYMSGRGLKEDRFAYIPNGINVMEWDNGTKTNRTSPHGRVLSQIRQEGKFIVGYAGAHGLANQLYVLIKAAAFLRTQPVAFVLVGSGPEKEKLQREVLQNGVQNVFFLEPVTRSAIPQLLASMDILYIGLKNEPLFRFGISPNKLMDYMMSGKPIIHAINAGNDLVLESSCGISVPPEDAEAIADAVIKLITMNGAERNAMGLRGREYAQARHDYRVLAERYLGLL